MWLFLLLWHVLMPIPVLLPMQHVECASHKIHYDEFTLATSTGAPATHILLLCSLPFPLCTANHLEKSDIVKVNTPTAVSQASLSPVAISRFLHCSIPPYMSCFSHSAPSFLFVSCLLAHQWVCTVDGYIRAAFPFWCGPCEVSDGGHQGHRLSDGFG